jgi:hypothetical protein
MELENESDGVLHDPSEADISRVFEPGEIVGHFIRLSRSPEDFLHVEFADGEIDDPPDWNEGIKGVYMHDPEYGRAELEDWSPDGYRSSTFGGSYREQLREMFLNYLRGPDAFAQWEKSWNGKFRGDC